MSRDGSTPGFLGLLLLVFCIPWEDVVLLPGIGTGARIAGVLALGAAAVSVGLEGRLRGHAVLIPAALFVAQAQLGLPFALDPGRGPDRVRTYLQLLVMLWLVVAFATDRARVRALLAAWVAGAALAAAWTFRAWQAGLMTHWQRFAAEGFDPNDLAMILALALVMALHLALAREGRGGLLALLYLPLGYGAVLLTASRTGTVAAAIASLYPLLLPGRISPLRRLGLALLGALALVAALQVIPAENLARIATIGSEVRSGSISDRVRIWRAGLELLGPAGLFGLGAGSFARGVEPLLGTPYSPHNVPLAIWVEQGLVGLLLLLAMVAAAVRGLSRLPVPERRLWQIQGAILLLACLTLNWEWRKSAWLLLGLMAAHVAAGRQEDADLPAPALAGARP